MNNLLEKWNEHIIKGNQLSRELEDIETLIEKSMDEDICFTVKPNGATYISVLPPEKMQELREVVVGAILQVRDEKTAELEKLMGIRKPVVINPEETEQEIVLQKCQDPIEEKLTEILDKQAKMIKGKPQMTVDTVKKLYIDEGKSYQEMADYFGVKKTDINNFITRYHLRELKQKHIYGYEKLKKPADEKERP